MGLFETIRSILGNDGAPPAIEVPMSEKKPDVAFRFNDRTDQSTWFLLNKNEMESIDFSSFEVSASYQAALLNLLVEQEAAVAVDRGFEVTNQALTALDPEHKAILGLPEGFQDQLVVHFPGTTTSERFDAQFAILKDGAKLPIHLDGPFIVDSQGRQFTATSPQFAALSAVQAFREAKARHGADEADAVHLVYELKNAQQDGLEVHLAQFERLNITQPSSIGVAAEQQDGGGLILRPIVGPLDPQQVARKLSQVPREAEHAVLRNDTEIVVLDRRSIQAIYEISDREIISKHNAAKFRESPGAFLDASLVDLDDFSNRVLGIGAITASKDPEAQEFSQDWFNDDQLPYTPEILHSLVTTHEELESARHTVSESRTEGKTLAAVQETIIDISDDKLVKRTFQAIADRFLAESSGEPEVDPAAATTTVKIGLVTEDVEQDIPDLTVRANSAVCDQPVDYAGLLRTPFPHQKVGVNWLVSLMQESFRDVRTDMYRLSGALLADDMGLGKTFTTLVALREFMSMDSAANGDARPILGVMPVALLENWKAEIGNTFEDSPFDDVIVLHGKTLNQFRANKGHETQISIQDSMNAEFIDPSQIRYALKVGKGHGVARLDRPRRLVLTTYAALRQYQLSLAAVNWGVVFFDEAQNVKEPNTAVTKAARALNAGFTLMATGTPVENSLRNIYTLLDIAQPGLLGSWEHFRRTWLPAKTETEPEERSAERLRQGQRLRAHIGSFMLRRTKEDELSGLPTKTIHTALEFNDSDVVRYEPWLSGKMSIDQESCYDQVLSEFKSSQNKRAATLPTLQKLREISLHPDVFRRNEGAWSKGLSSEASRSMMVKSGRFSASLTALDKIKSADEKVIIFAINLKLQFALKTWLKMLYGLDVHVINGDTKATSSSESDANQTRSALIRDFEAQPGFNVIIMSPLAAGVGLTVVGANHVIHLERHWNPAKEAQATDRVYRIGQTRNVHVYLPISKHSRLQSFDEHLNQLLLTKTDIKNAVVTPDWNEEKDALAPLTQMLGS